MNGDTRQCHLIMTPVKCQVFKSSLEKASQCKRAARSIECSLSASLFLSGLRAIRLVSTSPLFLFVFVFVHICICICIMRSARLVSTPFLFSKTQFSVHRCICQISWQRSGGGIWWWGEILSSVGRQVFSGEKWNVFVQFDNYICPNWTFYFQIDNNVCPNLKWYLSNRIDNYIGSKLYLFKFQNLAKSNWQLYLSKNEHYICPNWKLYLSKFLNVFVQISKFGQIKLTIIFVKNWTLYLPKLKIIFVHKENHICPNF